MSIAIHAIIIIVTLITLATIAQVCVIYMVYFAKQADRHLTRGGIFHHNKTLSDPHISIVLWQLRYTGSQVMGKLLVS